MALIDEKKVLDEKIEELNALIESEEFKHLENEDRASLVMQRNFMHGYSDILGKRIERNPEPKKAKPKAKPKTKKK